MKVTLLKLEQTLTLFVLQDISVLLVNNDAPETAFPVTENHNKIRNILFSTQGKKKLYEVCFNVV